MENRLQKQLLKYEQKLIIGTRTQSEILEELSKMLDFELIPTKEVIKIFSTAHLNALIYNSQMYKLANPPTASPAKDTLLQPLPESIDFDFYKLINNKKSMEYYNSRNGCTPITSIFDETDKTSVYIVFSHSNGYLYSNCNRLAAEATVLRGVAENDYKNQTDYFWGYISQIDFLEKGIYL